MAFATVSDIEARWRDLTVSEEARAAVLLDDAAAMLSKLVDVDPADTEQAALLKAVNCDMVIRNMSQTSSELYGVSQSSMTAGPYTQAMSYANPSGDMYLTKLERRLLGITSDYIGSIRPMIGVHDD